MPRILLSAAAVMLLSLALAQPANAAGPWRELHRPVHLPQVAPGQTCPVSKVDRRVDWESINIFGGSGIGRGPVYPGLGGTQNQNLYTQGNGPWFGGKLFWYVTPSYRGRVLIRGHRLDGPQGLRFKPGRSRELRIRRGETVEWRGQRPGSRGVPSGVLIRTSGCYGVQIDGTTFSRTVVFRASTP